jgi:hypothetical protein
VEVAGPTGNAEGLGLHGAMAAEPDALHSPAHPQVPADHGDKLGDPGLVQPSPARIPPPLGWGQLTRRSVGPN